MKLLHDNIDDVWVWVTDKDENEELSPRFDEIGYAMSWLSTITMEIRKRQNEQNTRAQR